MGCEEVEIEPSEAARLLLTADMVYLRTVEALTAVDVLAQVVGRVQEKHSNIGGVLNEALPAANQTSRISHILLSTRLYLRLSAAYHP